MVIVDRLNGQAFACNQYREYVEVSGDFDKMKGLVYMCSTDRTQADKLDKNMRAYKG